MSKWSIFQINNFSAIYETTLPPFRGPNLKAVVWAIVGFEIVTLQPHYIFQLLHDDLSWSSGKMAQYPWQQKTRQPTRPSLRCAATPVWCLGAKLSRAATPERCRRVTRRGKDWRMWLHRDPINVQKSLCAPNPESMDYHMWFSLSFCGGRAATQIVALGLPGLLS